MSPATLSRRGLFRGAAAAGVGASLTWPVPGVAHRDHTRDRAPAVPPKPIPGGIELPPPLPPVIHVHAPGDPTVTLPFSQVALEGFDVEPATLTDFKGFSAVAFHVGTATARDGTAYNLETDLRAFQGEYLDATGTPRFGTFAFI
jgi:hypothetical protein